MSRRERFVLGAILPLIVLPVLWFSAVDSCFFVENCEGCTRSLDIYQVRIFGYPISEQTVTYGYVHPERTHFAPPFCEHRQANRWLAQRYVGLVYCYSPCHCGTLRLSDQTRPLDTQNAQFAKSNSNG